MTAPLLFVRLGPVAGKIEVVVCPGNGAQHIFPTSLERAAGLAADLASFVALLLGRGHALEPGHPVDPYPGAVEFDESKKAEKPQWVGWDVASVQVPPEPPKSFRNALEQLAEGTKPPETIKTLAPDGKPWVTIKLGGGRVVQFTTKDDAKDAHAALSEYLREYPNKL